MNVQVTDATNTVEVVAPQSVVVSGAVAQVIVEDAGAQGPQGPKGDTGDTGPTGPAGPGVPVGGTEGQVLVKDSATDYDTSWSTLAVGKVLQVVSATSTEAWSTTSTDFVDVTGLSLTITPTTNTSKVLVFVNVGMAHTSSASFYIRPRLMRDSTAIIGTDPAANDQTFMLTNFNSLFGGSAHYLDAPATTSAVVYKLQARTEGGTGYINRNNGNTRGSISSITAMEIAA